MVSAPTIANFLSLLSSNLLILPTSSSPSLPSRSSSILQPCSPQVFLDFHQRYNRPPVLNPSSFHLTSCQLSPVSDKLVEFCSNVIPTTNLMAKAPMSG